MTEMIFSLYIFLQIFYLLVIVDVIISWISVFMGRSVRPQFISSLLDPVYIFIKKHIPTTFGPFEFTPIIILFIIWFLQIILLSFFPEIS